MPSKKQSEGIPIGVAIIYFAIVLVISSLINVTAEPFDTWFSVFLLGFGLRGVSSAVVILIIEYLRRK